MGDAAGTCQGTDTSAVDCNDNLACTTDTCDPTTGCANTAMNALCDDANVCTVDTCDTLLGCLNDGMGVIQTCDDDDACTAEDVCQGDDAGTCIGTFADSDGDGVCDAEDICPGCDDRSIPTVSQWGMAVMTLLLLAFGGMLIQGRP